MPTWLSVSWTVKTIPAGSARFFAAIRMTPFSVNLIDRRGR